MSDGYSAYFEQEKVKELKRIAEELRTANLIAFNNSNAGFPGDAERRREIAIRLGYAK